MTQTVVNFITGTTPVSGILPSEYRVFDFEITNSSYDFYKQAMQNISDYFNGVAIGGDAAVKAMYSLVALNRWSGMGYVDSNGVQQTRANTSLQLLATLNQTAINNTGSPLPPDIAALFSDPPVNFVAFSQGGILLTTSASGSNTNPVLTSTMDKYMAQALQNITRTLAAAGFDVNSVTTDDTSAQSGSFMAAVNALKPPTSGTDIYQFQNLLNSAFNAAEKSKRIDDPTTDPVILRNRLLATSEQQMLQVDYVSRGNEILFNQMDQLNQALSINDTALGFLNSLQDLMNQKDPEKFVLQLQFLNMTSLNYKDYETQTFTNPLGTVARFADSGLQTYIDPSGQEVQFASQAFKNDIFDTSSTAFTATKAKLLANLDLLSTKIGEASGGTATRLVDAITKIRQDINGVNSIQDWVQDTTTGQEGDYQRHINDALVASQSFNDTQREELRRVMFVFEEFYKSATALLSQLGSLIDKGFSYIGR